MCLFLSARCMMGELALKSGRPDPTLNRCCLDVVRAKRASRAPLGVRWEDGSMALDAVDAVDAVDCRLAFVSSARICWVMMSR